MRRYALLPLLLGIGCSHGAPVYRHFSDVPYNYGEPEKVWSKAAKFSVHIEQLGPKDSPEVPIVLLHPWGLSMTVWADVAPELAKDRRVLLVDLPGHGKSDKLHTHYPMRRLAHAVLSAMDAAGIHRAVLIGNSLGGATSIAVAELAPERVEALVLVAAPGGHVLAQPILHAVRSMANDEWLATLSDEAWFVGLVLAGRSLGPTAVRVRDDLIGLRHAEAWRAWCRATIRILRSVATYEPQLESLTMPALVVHGTGDPLIRASFNASMARRLPKGELKVLDGCGHMPEIECPDALLEVIRPFVASLPAPSRRVESADDLP